MTKKLTEENKQLLKDFAVLKVQVKTLKTEIENIKPLVRSLLLNTVGEDTPVVTDLGKISLRPRRAWIYSDELKGDIAKVKSDQKLEEATGKATFETLFDVYFK